MSDRTTPTAQTHPTPSPGAEPLTDDELAAMQSTQDWLKSTGGMWVGYGWSQVSSLLATITALKEQVAELKRYGTDVYMAETVNVQDNKIDALQKEVVELRAERNNGYLAIICLRIIAGELAPMDPAKTPADYAKGTLADMREVKP